MQYARIHFYCNVNPRQIPTHETAEWQGHAAGKYIMESVDGVSNTNNNELFPTEQHRLAFATCGVDIYHSMPHRWASTGPLHMFQVILVARLYDI